MNAIDHRIAQLYQYIPEITARPDFHDFWERTLAENLKQPLKLVRNEVQTPLLHAKTYKIVFEGYSQTPIHGWFLLPPVPVRKPAPCIVMFHGYTGSKGEPEDYAAWLLMGFAVFAVDIRGQGGETGNKLMNDFGMTKGWITQGILDKDTCYYKAISLDGLRAFQCALEQPEIDPDRIIAMGTSQGGGLALMTAALHPKVRMTVANVPNMCHMDFGILNSTGSLTEAAEFVHRFPDRLDAVLTTLSYFDIMNLADRISVPVMVSVGLKDTICLPETVFAAFNRLASTEKTMQIYPFTGHDVGRGHMRKVYEFIMKYL
jgi:cephalosporin-C deacetylase